MITFVCKTYEAEIDLAIIATKSILKYCKTDFEILLFVDNSDEVNRLRNCLSSSDKGISIFDISIFNKVKNVGYIDQQCIKVDSYKFANGEYIFFYDSDMIFWRNFELNDFLINGKCILPFAEWTRPPFLSKSQIRAIQLHAGQDFFFVGDIENYLRGLSKESLSSLGYSAFISNQYANVLIGIDGTVFRWTTNYPDLLWSLSSGFMSKTYYAFDTMRCHYIVKTSSMKKLGLEIEKLYSSIWEVAYNRDILPVFSEFQIIGNFLLESVYGEGSEDYYPLPFPFLFSNYSFLSKIPVIKFNGKNNPIALYNEILNGEYKDVVFKSDIRRMLGAGWD